MRSCGASLMPGRNGVQPLNGRRRASKVK
jgi:hypothetical protein